MNRGQALALAIAVAALPMGGAVGAPAATLKIGWDGLRPAAGSAGDLIDVRNDAAAGKELSWNLQGKTVEIAGYVLPSDREGDLVYQFVLIPWSGLCSHIAPPPANQAVLINLKEPYRLSETYATVSVTGILQPQLERTQLFIFDGVSVIESGYRITGAQIAPVTEVKGAASQPKTNPWGFVRK